MSSVPSSPCSAIQQRQRRRTNSSAAPFLLAYGVEAEQIDAVSVMIAQAWDEHDELLIINPGYSLN